MDDLGGGPWPGERRHWPWRWLLLGLAALLALGGGLLLVVLDPGTPTVVEAPAPPAPDAATRADPDEVAAGTAGRFPTVRSADLNGQEVVLPADLPGATTVVLLSWERGDQGPVDDWIAALAPAEAEHDGLDHVQLAITGDSSAVTRTTVNFFMRQAMPDEATRARTIPLFTDAAVLADLLGVPADRGVALVVVEDDGTITWRHTGEVDAQAEADLLAHLAAGA